MNPTAQIPLVIDNAAPAHTVAAGAALVDWIDRHDGAPVMITLVDATIMRDSKGRPAPLLIVGEIRGGTVYTLSATLHTDAIIARSLGVELATGADLAVPLSEAGTARPKPRRVLSLRKRKRQPKAQPLKS